MGEPWSWESCSGKFNNGEPQCGESHSGDPMASSLRGLVKILLRGCPEFLLRRLAKALLRGSYEGVIKDSPEGVTKVSP